MLKLIILFSCLFSILWQAQVSTPIYSQTINSNSIIVYPNPFVLSGEHRVVFIKLKGSPPTDINASIAFTVYNSLLNKVFESTFHNGSQARWNGYDSNGSKVPVGIYFLKIIATSPDGQVSNREFKLLIQ